MITCHVHREPGAVEPVLIQEPTALSGHCIRIVLKKACTTAPIGSEGHRQRAYYIGNYRSSFPAHPRAE